MGAEPVTAAVAFRLPEGTAACGACDEAVLVAAGEGAAGSGERLAAAEPIAEPLGDSGGRGGVRAGGSAPGRAAGGRGEVVIANGAIVHATTSDRLPLSVVTVTTQPNAPVNAVDVVRVARADGALLASLQATATPRGVVLRPVGETVAGEAAAPAAIVEEDGRYRIPFGASAPANGAPISGCTRQRDGAYLCDVYRSPTVLAAGW
jgi:hypothetical protein